MAERNYFGGDREETEDDDASGVTNAELDGVSTIRMVQSIRRRLGPHGGVAAVTIHDLDDCREGVRLYHYGGFTLARGLIDEAQTKLDQQSRAANDRAKEGNEGSAD